MANQALAEFIDAELSGLRRMAFLLSGSWRQADQAVEDALVAEQRRGTDFADGPRALAAVRRRVVRDCQRSTELVDGPQVDSDDPAERLGAALGELDHTHRAAVVLGWFSRLTDDEVQAALELGHVDIAALKQSAIDELRASLARHGDKLVTDDDAERLVQWKRPRGARALDFDDEVATGDEQDTL